MVVITDVILNKKALDSKAFILDKALSICLPSILFLLILCN